MRAEAREARAEAQVLVRELGQHREQLAELEHLTSDELMRRFMETLAEQTERHDGGDKWVGTGGRSPYGHGGVQPTGIRVGGPAKSRSAMKVAEERRLSNYRTDVALDVHTALTAAHWLGRAVLEPA